MYFVVFIIIEKKTIIYVNKSFIFGHMSIVLYYFECLIHESILFLMVDIRNALDIRNIIFSFSRTNSKLYHSLNSN